jgi:hypothetical protein
MKFLGLWLVLLSFTNAFFISPRKSYERTFPSLMASHKNLSISVIHVSYDNLDILENSKKFAFIKLENISNHRIEEVFFRSIVQLEDNGALLFDLQKYQHHLLRTMMEHHCLYDFSNVEMNTNTFFWSKKLN